MGDQYIEKKVHYLGSWGNNRVDNQTISQINSQIATEKGTRVKLQLGGDGLRTIKTTMIQGKMLHEYIPLEKIQVMTVSQNLPDLLMVISLAKGDKAKFQISAYRCANGLDAGMYLQIFRALQKKVKTVQVVPTRIVNKDDDINWTLRSKEYDNSKRELKQFVDLHGEKAEVHKIGEGSVVIKENGTTEQHRQNGHTEVYENGVRIPLYRKGRPTRTEKESVESDISDNRSEVSETALRSELENLSQELRDIKIMLEHSTGIAPGHETDPESPGEFQSVNVNVHKHTVPADNVVIQRAETNGDDRIETEVLDEEPVVMRRQENGVSTSTSGAVTHVRVNVPDYRNFNENSTSYTVTTTKVPPQERQQYEVVTPRTSTTSYESWKKNTMERNAVRYSELPERIQWKSRPRQSHVVTTRSRSAIPVWATDAPDGANGFQVRHHSAGFGPAYQRVSFNPRVVRIDKKAHSMRARALSTTVAKPIEKVYTGRPDAKHHSLSYRNSAGLRPSILVTKESVPNNTQQTIVLEQNNNVVKPDTDDQLLDVSGIDLYKETPIEGAVIRT